MLSITHGILEHPEEAVWLAITGLTTVAVRVTGELDGTIEFEYSRDGVNYSSAEMIQWESSGNSTATSTTEAGNWFWRNLDYKFFRVRRTAPYRLGAGIPYVTVGASNDGQFADVFMLPSARFQTSESTTNATHTMTVTKNEYKAHRLTKLVVSYSGGVPVTASALVTDDTVRLWYVDLKLRTGPQDVPLPAEGIIGTPNRDLHIVVAAAGTGVMSRINAELRSA